MTIRISFVTALLSVLFALPAYAEDAKGPDFEKSTLTGDWGGLRDDFYQKGIDIEGQYILDFWRNASGGVKTGNVVNDSLSVTAALDGEKLLDIGGLSAFVHLLNNNGGHINRNVGSNGGIDNIEVGTPTFKLYQLWVQQNWMDDKVSVLAGLYDLNSEFDVTSTSALFINPTYGIATEIAATGINGPSVFPNTAVGARVKIKPTADTYVQFAALDAVAGAPGHPHGTHINFTPHDGALLVAEAGFNGENAAHYGVGTWYYTSRFDDFVDVDTAGNPLKHHNKGAYVIAERNLYQDDNGGTLNGFIRLGIADGDVSRYQWSGSTGVVYTGLFPSRPDGQLGFAISDTANSDKYSASSGGLKKHETQLELTYSDNLTPWLKVQPDIQYTKNPGTVSERAPAVTLGVRFKINF